MIRAVIDTSILILALIKLRGTVGPVLQGLRDAARQLVYSDPLLAEPADVLARPRLAKKYGVTTEDVATVLPLILLRGKPVLSARRIGACREPKDNMGLDAAVAGQVHFIVSGDKDLLTLTLFEGFPVVKPAAFFRKLTSHNSRA
jgi:putative PIN family toxin of toxin-antitoxin system